MAPNNAAYYPFGVDVFRSHQKINHIARFVELPPIYSCEKIPPILVVNIQVVLQINLSVDSLFCCGLISDSYNAALLLFQIPLYPASVFHRESDGEGMNVVQYFRLSDRFSKDLPRQFQENVRVRSVYLSFLIWTIVFYCLTV